VPTVLGLLDGAHLYSGMGRNLRTELFRIRDGDIVFRDLSDEEPDVKATLRRELLALSETADRLGRDRRVFPPPGGTAYVQCDGQLR
jgi:hypothetical protein